MNEQYNSKEDPRFLMSLPAELAPERADIEVSGVSWWCLCCYSLASVGRTTMLS